LEEIYSQPDGFLPVLINLEKHDTAEAWLAEMLAELRRSIEQPASGFRQKASEKIAVFLDRIRKIDIPKLGGIELDKPKAEAAWRKPADEFLALLSESDLPVLFLLDEFPTFLKLVAKKTSRDEVEAVLNWFRAARHSLKHSLVRFLVTGSIGLKSVVKGLGLAPSINEFDTHEIPPLTDEEALGLLETLAKDNHLELDLPGRKHILNLLGGNWPILLQLFISEIQECQGSRSPTLDDLDRLYQERLVCGARNQYCDGMYDRLKEIFSASEYHLAREILKATCQTGDGLSRDDFEAIHARVVPSLEHRMLVAEELDYVLDTLKHDGYLLQRTTGKQLTRFGSNILRDFWLRKTA
jgi:hypothetical protein